MTTKFISHKFTIITIINNINNKTLSTYLIATKLISNKFTIINNNNKKKMTPTTTTTRHCQHVWLQQSSSLTTSTSSLSTSLLVIKFTCTTRNNMMLFSTTRYYVFVSFEFSLLTTLDWTKLFLARFFLIDWHWDESLQPISTRHQGYYKVWSPRPF